MNALPPPSFFLLISAVVAVACLVHGYSGFGFGLLSFAVFSLLPYDLEWVSIVITVDSLLVFVLLYFLTRSRGHVAWADVGVLTAGMLIGLPLGYWLLSTFKDAPAFRGVVGAIVAAFGCYGLSSVHTARRISRPWGVGAGMLSGCISGAMVSGGPPTIVYLYSRVRDARDMKATVQVAFIFASMGRMAVAGVQSRVIDWPLFVVAGFTVPLTIAFVMLGHRLAHYGSPATFKRIVYGLIAVIGFAGMVRWAVAGWLPV